MQFVKAGNMMKTDNIKNADIISKQNPENSKRKNTILEPGAPSKIMKAECVTQDSKMQGETTIPADCHWKKLSLTNRQKIMLEGFLLRQHGNDSPLSIINSSVGFCKLFHEYTFHQVENPQGQASTVGCCVHVNGVLVGEGYATNKKSAKQAAAIGALELLRTTQPTVMITSNPGNLETALSRSDVKGRSSTSNEQKITDLNIGNKLLRKMGWQGHGGLGKSGTGISAPVTVSETFNRAGLGLEMTEPTAINYKDACIVITNYASSDSKEELVFSPELTSDERKKIHKLASRFSLRSKSYANGELRYLVVSRKKTAAGLLEELKSSGGKQGGIELIRPGEM